MRWVLLAAKHLGWAVLAAVILLLMDANPRVLVLTYLLLVPLRIAAVEGLMRVHEGRLLPAVRPQLRRFSRPPGPGDIMVPWTHQDGSARPVGGAGYLLMAAVYGVFILSILYGGVAAESGWSTLALDLAHAAPLVLLYGAEELAGRSLAVDFSKDRPENHACNVGMWMLLLHFLVFVSVLAGAAYGAGRGWHVFGPLLAMKHLMDFAREALALTAPR